VLHKNKKQVWYATTREDARIVNVLTHIASKGQPKEDPDWITCKLKQDMKVEVDRDFCVLYKNGEDDCNDTIFGVLFFQGEDCIFSVPNVIDNYSGWRAGFNFHELRSRL
jgi:hypothetical protein